MFEKRLVQSVLAVSVMSLLALVTLYLIHWDIFFDSDKAMVGLMVKAMIERAEYPIYVWHVGYQGMLLEGSLLAVYFKLFGITPITLNLAAATYYLLFVACFYWLVSSRYNPRVAAFSLYLLVVSTPWLYWMGLRALPNYAETFFLGFLFWNLYLYVLDLLRGGGFSSDKKNKILLLSVLVGLVGGLAVYAFSLVGLFLISVVFHFLTIRKRDNLNLNKNAFFTLGSGVLTGFLVGYLPAIYYKYVLGGGTIKKVSLGGPWHKIPERFDLALETHLKMFHFDGSPFDGLVLLLFLCSAVYFIGVHVKFFRDKKMGPFTPLVFLPFVGLLVFSFSKAVVDIHTGRYIIILYAFYAVALACFSSKVYDLIEKRWLRLAAVCGILLSVTVNSGQAFIDDFKYNRNHDRYMQVVAALERKNLKFGFGDYWYAYSVTYLAGERIIIDPVYSSYYPRYRSQVLNESRVAYLHNKAFKHGAPEIKIENGMAQHLGQVYRVTDHEVVHQDVDLYVLERLK